MASRWELPSCGTRDRQGTDRSTAGSAYGGPTSPRNHHSFGGSVLSGEVVSKIDGLEQRLDHQILVHRNSCQRQQECLDKLQLLEETVRAMNTTLSVAHKDPGTELKAHSQEPMNSVHAQPQAKVRDAQPNAPLFSSVDIMEALEQKCSAMSAQIQGISSELKRSDAKSAAIEQSILQNQETMKAHFQRMQDSMSEMHEAQMAHVQMTKSLSAVNHQGPALLAQTVEGGASAEPRPSAAARPELCNTAVQTETTLVHKSREPMSPGSSMMSPAVTPAIPDMVPDLTGMRSPAEVSRVPSETAEGGRRKKAGEAKQDVVALQAAMGWAPPPEPEETEKPEVNFIVRIAQSTLFNMTATIMILANIIYMAYITNYAVNDYLIRVNCRDSTTDAFFDPLTPLDKMTYDVFDGLEIFFFVWMALELTINIIASFWNGCQDWKWNVFDSLILFTSALEIMMTTTNLSILRLGKLYKLVRVMRVGKVFKVLRIFRFLTGVRKMVLSVLGSLMSLFWAFSLMTLIMFIVGIIFLQGVEGHALNAMLDMQEDLRNNVTSVASVCPAGPADSESGRQARFYMESWETNNEALQRFYGGIIPVMVTLFRAISSGAEWAEVAEPVTEISSLYLIIWIVFVAFMIFGVLNILTGVFCDAAMKAANDDRDMMMQEMMQEQESAMNSLRGIFLSADADGSGQVNKEEFETVIKQRSAQMQLNALGINPSEAAGLFELLDDDESGFVGVEEFVTGCMRLKGGAKSVDMITLLFENKKIRKHLSRIDEVLVEAFNVKRSKPNRRHHARDLSPSREV